MKNFNIFIGVFFTVYFLQTININAGELNDDTVLASVNGEDIAEVTWRDSSKTM